MAEFDYKGLGEVLRRLRLAQGYTLRELAEKADVSHQLVDKAEKGKPIRIDSFVRLSEAVGARFVGYIEAGEDERKGGQVMPPPDRLKVASRLMAVLPRLPDDIVDRLLHDVALWETQYPPDS